MVGCQDLNLKRSWRLQSTFIIATPVWKVHNDAADGDDDHEDDDDHDDDGDDDELFFKSHCLFLNDHRASRRQRHQ